MIRNESCDGACNGQLSIHLVGGTPPYIGSSTNQSGNIISSNMIGDSILGDMCSGVWDVVLTDVNGCTSSLMLGGVGQETVTYNYTTSSQINQSTVQHVLCYGSSTGKYRICETNEGYYS